MKSSQKSQIPCPSEWLSSHPVWQQHTGKAACVPVFISVFILLRKYHPKPHLSCIGCSLTFHFVWQTLIFTSKVLSRRHPTRAYLPCRLSKGCLSKNCGNNNNPTLLKQTQRSYKETQVLFNVGAAINWGLSINSFIPLVHLQRNHDSYQTSCPLIKEG